jgi:hypothetical protein
MRPNISYVQCQGKLLYNYGWNVTEEYKVFRNSLNLEYKKYKKMSFDEFLKFESTLNIPDRKIYTLTMDYKSLLKHSYRHYSAILKKCLYISSKKELKDLRGKAHIISNVYDPFIRMYWVVQDALYYYISILNKEMHKINLMFIEFFKHKLNESVYYGPQKEVFNFYTTPSCLYFRPLLLEYNERYLEEIEFSPIFAMFLYPITLTDFGKKNILGIIDVFGEKLNEYYEKNNISLLRYHFTRYKRRNLDRMKKLKDDIELISTESENKYRQNKNIPKIGENWIEETLLYYKIKEDFPSLKVIQHGKPAFLGQQHYDIWIPNILLAIEYQGEQHFKPIEYFGGEETYKKQIERDKRKYDLSIENGITLLYVSKGYNYGELKNKIKSKN